MNDKIKRVSELLDGLSDEDIKLVWEFTKSNKQEIVYYVNFGIRTGYSSYHDSIKDLGVNCFSNDKPYPEATHKIVFNSLTRELKYIERLG